MRREEFKWNRAGGRALPQWREPKKKLLHNCWKICWTVSCEPYPDMDYLDFFPEKDVEARKTLEAVKEVVQGKTGELFVTPRDDLPLRPHSLQVYAHTLTVEALFLAIRTRLWGDMMIHLRPPIHRTLRYRGLYVPPPTRTGLRYKLYYQVDQVGVARPDPILEKIYDSWDDDRKNTVAATTLLIELQSMGYPMIALHLELT